MYRHCLYCRRTLSGSGEAGSILESTRAEVRIAFDPPRGRLWSICDECFGWNLWWWDERWEALEKLERAAHDQARVVYESDHVALLELPGRSIAAPRPLDSADRRPGPRQLVRVGPAPRPEEAWWRYGRQLRRRRAHMASPLTRVGTATYAVAHAAASRLVEFAGARRERPLEGLKDPRSVVRWRRFGGTAWTGRAPCPYCSSALIRLFFFRTPELMLVPAAGGGATLALPCTRCDPWSDDRAYRFDTASAEPVLQRVLAWDNIAGASEYRLRRAISRIEAAGSAERYVQNLAEQRLPLQALGETNRLALEIAVNERAEHRRLSNEAAALDAAWRRAEELAAIIDGELTPP